MKTKTMKKLTALSLMMAVSVWMMGGAFAVASAGDVTTSLTSDTSGGENPIVKAKWEMNITKDSGGYLGEDDDAITAGAQFTPSGLYQVNKRIALCSIVTDPDGLDDIDNVYADVFYPEDVALGNHHVKLSGQSGLGCGQLMQEDSLNILSKADGIELFCNRIRNNNNNLPTFGSNYNYDEICKADGELQKETAAVYCGEKELSYEDPSGEYKVWAVAQDKNGLQGTLQNYFKYLPVTAFEVDFTSVNYGNVRLNTHKIISGNLLWEPANSTMPTVRNVGNTRLSMEVMQDDMGLGLTGDAYNVKYDGRVGSDASFVDYVPFQTITLSDPLDLSEMNEMDFSIDISKFPPTHTEDCYTGTMTLSAISAPHLTCDGI